MKKLIVIIFALLQCMQMYSQNSGTTLEWICRPNIIAVPEDLDYVVDNMHFDHEQFLILDITDFKTLKCDKKILTVICTTRLLIVFNEQLYFTNEEKKQLSSVEVKSVERVDNTTARKLYGRKGRHGALIVNYTQIPASRAEPAEVGRGQNELGQTDLDSIGDCN